MFSALSCTRAAGCTRSGPPGERDHLMQPAWSHVGSGQGDFELHERYGYVGEGQGGWKREVVTTYEGWRFKPQCKAVTVVIVSCTFGLAIGVAIRQAPGTTERLGQWRENLAAMLHPRWTEVGVATGPLPVVGPDPASAGAGAPGATLATTERPAVGAGAAGEAAGEAREVGEVEAGGQLYKCQDGSVDNWGVGKKDWCCQQVSFGCREGSEDPGHFDCGAGPPGLWAEAKAKHCCKTHDLGCPTLAPPKRDFDCKDIPAGGREAWPPEKRSFCDAQDEEEEEDVEHDCSKNLRSWVTEWTPDKKAWCCRHKHVACPPDPNMMGGVP